MATAIALLVTIESTGAAVVLLPHGAEPPRPSPAADSTSLSSPSGQALSVNANVPKHVTLNSTNVLTYASLSSVEDGRTTAPSASSSLAATVAPNATSTVAADADGKDDDILCKTK